MASADFTITYDKELLADLMEAVEALAHMAGTVKRQAAELRALRG